MLVVLINRFKFGFEGMITSSSVDDEFAGMMNVTLNGNISRQHDDGIIAATVIPMSIPIYSVLPEYTKTLGNVLHWNELS